MMKLCPLVEDDNESLIGKDHCILQIWNFFRKEAMIYRRLTGHQTLPESNLRSVRCVTPFPKHREDATVSSHTAALPAAHETFCTRRPQSAAGQLPTVRAP